MSFIVGPSGNGENFFKCGYKRSIDAPKWINELGLSAYEYSFGRGFNTSLQTAESIGENAKKFGIKCSVHAPFYINFANENPEMIEKSYNYVLKSLEYLNAFQGEHCVFHPASCGKLSRDKAIELCYRNINLLVEKIYFNGYENFSICPETMGKSAQIGDYKEIINLCKIDKILVPCFDFGHINALGQGCLKSEEDYYKIFDYAFSNLDESKVINCHMHFSKIKYGDKGEIKHLDFDDCEYGPNFEHLAHAIKHYNLNPHIICESSTQMSEDALIMKQILQNL